MRHLRWVIPMLLVGMTLACTSPTSNAPTPAQVQAMIDRQKSFDFDLNLTSLDGKPLKLSEMKGKVVVVDFWGTWCPPCRLEVPHFIKLSKEYGDRIQVVGVNYERAANEEAAKAMVQEFLDEYGVNYPCALGDESTKNQVPNFQAFPTTLFVGTDGRVRLMAVGYHDYGYLEAIVKTLLAEGSAT